MIQNYNLFYVAGTTAATLLKSKFSTISRALQEITPLGMPSLSPSMEEGEIVAWRAKEGAPFKEGEVLCSVQTDKAVVDFAATEDGILAKILTPPKERVKVGTPIAYVAENEKDLKEFQLKGPKTEEITPKPTSTEPGKIITPEKVVEKIQKQEPAPQIAEGGQQSLPIGVVELGMPSLSPSMEEGSIAKWNKKEGDKINEGDVICSIQTDKAAVDFSSTEEGYLAKILKKEGESAKVNAAIALIAEKKEQIAAIASMDLSKTATTVSTAKPTTVKAADMATMDTKLTTTSKPQPPEISLPKSGIEQEQKQIPPKEGERVPISPQALQLLESNTKFSRNDLTSLINEGKITPTGQYGSIVVVDVEKALESLKKPTKKVPPAPKKAAKPEEEEFVDVPVSAIREVIARRLSQSKRTIPHYYLAIQVDVDNLVEAREKINKLLESSAKLDGKKQQPKKISVNDMIIKAVAAAIKQVPEINSGWIEKEAKQSPITGKPEKPEPPVIRMWKNIDICVAIQTDAGLMAPIVKKADTLGMTAISEKVRELSIKAKENRLQPEEFQGGTFTISNLGMFGIDHFSAVVNPPQSAILSVGRIQRKVVENPKFNEKSKNENTKESQFKVANVMDFELSLDHRVIDGAIGAKFLAKFKELMENPLLLAV